MSRLGRVIRNAWSHPDRDERRFHRLMLGAICIGCALTLAWCVALVYLFQPLLSLIKE